MRFLSLFVFLLFCIYALVARWYFVCEVRGLCGEEQQVEDIRLKTLKLTEEDSVILQGYDQFAFDSASFQPRLNADNEAFLDTLAAILKANPGRNMTITAFYRDSEKDIKPGFFENIGLARADQVRKLLMKRGIEQNRISLDHGLSEDADARRGASRDLERHGLRVARGGERQGGVQAADADDAGRVSGPDLQTAELELLALRQTLLRHEQELAELRDPRAR